MDLWQFIKDSFDQLRGEFITTQDHMAPVLNANQKKNGGQSWEDWSQNEGKNENVGWKLFIGPGIRGQFKSTEKHLTDLLKVSNEQIKEPQSVVADHKDKTKQILVRTDNSSEENQLVKSSYEATTASQMNVNMTEHKSW